MLELMVVLNAFFTLASQAKDAGIVTVAFRIASPCAVFNEIASYTIKYMASWVYFIFAFISFSILAPIFFFYGETAI